MSDSPYLSLVPKDYQKNLDFRADLLNQASRDRAMQQDLKRMCAADILFAINTFYWTVDPRITGQRKVSPFITYDYQDPTILEINDAIETGHDLVIKKSRDMGLSWMILMTFDWRWRFCDNELLLLVSRTKEYVDQRGNPKALFTKLDFIDDHMPAWMMPKGFDKAKHRTEMHKGNPENGSVIDGESTTKDLAAGDRRAAILIDEFGRFDAGDSYSVMSATRDVSKCRIFNSSVRGTANAFADMIESEDFKHKLWIPWYLHPEKKVGLYESDGLRKAPDHKGKKRSPWYDNECARAVHPFEIQQELDGDLVNSNAQFFDTNMLTRCLAQDAMEPLHIGELNFDQQSGNLVQGNEFYDVARGRLKLWFHPDVYNKVHPDRRCAVGIDVAVGTGASNSVISVADRDTGEKLAEFCDPRTRPEQLASYAVALCRWFNDAFMVPEANGPGQIFIKIVLEMGYSNMYFREQEKRIDRPISRFPGWWAGVDEKRTLFSDYAKALADGRFINRSKLALEECRQIVFTVDNAVEHSSALRNIDPSGAKLNHGDMPTADALCWKGCRETVLHKEEVAIPRTTPIGSQQWRYDQGQQSDFEEAVW